MFIIENSKKDIMKKSVHYSKRKRIYRYLKKEGFFSERLLRLALEPEVLQKNKDFLIFINAIGSPDILLKRLGYLGISSLDITYQLLVVNGIRKDISPEKTREVAALALRYLANVKPEHLSLYLDLKSCILTEKNIRENYSLTLLAFSSIVPSDKCIRISCRNDTHIFIKLQIIYDKVTEKKCDIFSLLSENDIEYMKSFLMRATSDFSCVKTLQLLILYATSKQKENETFTFENSFLKMVDQRITNLQKGFWPAVNVLYAELLLVCRYESSRANGIVFQLISNQNAHFQNIGYKLVKKYKILRDCAFEKIMKSGIVSYNHLKTFLSMIKKSDIQRILDNKNILVCNTISQNILQKESIKFWRRICEHIFELSEKKMKILILKENSRILDKLDLKSVFKEEEAVALFESNKGTRNIECLFFLKKILETYEIEDIDYVKFFLNFSSVLKDNILIVSSKVNFLYIEGFFELLLSVGNLIVNYEIYKNFIKDVSKSMIFHKLDVMISEYDMLFLLKIAKRSFIIEGVLIWYIVYFDVDEYKKIIKFESSNLNLEFYESNDYCITESHKENNTYSLKAECYDFEINSINLDIKLHEKETRYTYLLNVEEAITLSHENN